jgi:hypothetical protein
MKQPWESIGVNLYACKQRMGEGMAIIRDAGLAYNRNS